MRVPAELGGVRALFQAADCQLLAVSSHSQERTEEARSLLTLHPILITFQRPCLLIPSHCGVYFQHMNVGDTNIQSLTDP